MDTQVYCSEEAKRWILLTIFEQDLDSLEQDLTQSVRSNLINLTSVMMQNVVEGETPALLPAPAFILTAAVAGASSIGSSLTSISVPVDPSATSISVGSQTTFTFPTSVLSNVVNTSDENLIEISVIQFLFDVNKMVLDGAESHTSDPLAPISLPVDNMVSTHVHYEIRKNGGGSCHGDYFDCD